MQVRFQSTLWGARPGDAGDADRRYWDPPHEVVGGARLWVGVECIRDLAREVRLSLAGPPVLTKG